MESLLDCFRIKLCETVNAFIFFDKIVKVKVEIQNRDLSLKLQNIDGMAVLWLLWFRGSHPREPTLFFDRIVKVKVEIQNRGSHPREPTLFF